MKKKGVTLYHGTNHQEVIESFWPNSHFGSKTASIDALAAKWLDLVETANPSRLFNSLGVELYLSWKIIEVELEYEDSYCLTTEHDWGNPSPIALSNLLRNTTGFETLFSPIYADLVNFKNTYGRNTSRDERAAALRHYGDPLVTEALETKGIKVIKYKNKVEGENSEGVREYSYCVFDPRLILIHTVDQVQKNDFLDGVERISKSR